LEPLAPCISRTEKPSEPEGNPQTLVAQKAFFGAGLADLVFVEPLACLFGDLGVLFAALPRAPVTDPVPTLATTITEPAPGMRLVSSPLDHRMRRRLPLIAVTTPSRGGCPALFGSALTLSPTEATATSAMSRLRFTSFHHCGSGRNPSLPGEPPGPPRQRSPGLPTIHGRTLQPTSNLLTSARDDQSDGRSK